MLFHKGTKATFTSFNWQGPFCTERLASFEYCLYLCGPSCLNNSRISWWIICPYLIDTSLRCRSIYFEMNKGAKVFLEMFHRRWAWKWMLRGPFTHQGAADSLSCLDGWGYIQPCLFSSQLVFVIKEIHFQNGKSTSVWIGIISREIVHTFSILYLILWRYQLSINFDLALFLSPSIHLDVVLVSLCS